MHYLNLDPNFTPHEGAALKFNTFTFPGGEPHIKLDYIVPKKDMQITITHRIQSFNDIGLLLIAVDAVRRTFNPKKLKLFLPYFPGARQDRIMVSGEAFTLKVYANLINSLNFDKVYILDPHSDVTPALIDNVKVLSNHFFIQKCIFNIGRTTNSIPVIVSPDAGANKKIKELAMFIGGVKVVKCDKTRDVDTGRITGFEAYTDDLKGQSCLIVDDICDGGGTFNGLAAELKNKGAGKLYLAVSHGIFSKGFVDLNKNFDGIYTTDSYPNIDNEAFCLENDNKYHKVTQFKLSYAL